MASGQVTLVSTFIKCLYSTLPSNNIGLFAGAWNESQQPFNGSLNHGSNYKNCADSNKENGP